MPTRSPSFTAYTRFAPEYTGGTEAAWRAPARAAGSAADASHRVVSRNHAFNACAKWIAGFSHHACRPGTLWFTSGALLLVVGRLVACGLAVCFALRPL